MPETESQMVTWAREELERAGTFEEDPAFAQSVLDAVEGFISYGHSGGSAPVAAYLIGQLVAWKPLSPLTRDPSEWMNIHGPDSPYPEGARPGNPLWQSRRSSSCFSQDGGLTFWDIDERQPWWRRAILRRVLRGYGGNGRGLRRHASAPAR